jgi:hypothetical protein
MNERNAKIKKSSKLSLPSSSCILAHTQKAQIPKNIAVPMYDSIIK